MADTIGMATHLAGQALRTGWYFGLHALTDRMITGSGRRPPPVRPMGPVPSTNALMRDLLALHLADARDIRDRVHPLPLDPDMSPVRQLALARDLLRDLPRTIARQVEGGGTEIAREQDGKGLPDYFLQNFHFQTGGYLTEESARLYDEQVETLFRGAANAMRRQALRPIWEHVRGRDQRRLALADVACGTGRFLGQLAQAFPALPATGLDLSHAYLAEARRHLRARPRIRLLQANAEALPLADASQDIVTSIFLFHELPGPVRRTVTDEIARVLKPGGLFVFIDSLQLGDRPDYDGLLEAFPARFHEPYFANYIADDLDAAFAQAGLAAVSSRPAFLSKVMVRRKTA